MSFHLMEPTTAPNPTRRAAGVERARKTALWGATIASIMEASPKAVEAGVSIVIIYGIYRWVRATGNKRWWEILHEAQKIEAKYFGWLPFIGSQATFTLMADILQTTEIHVEGDVKGTNAFWEQAKREGYILENNLSPEELELMRKAKSAISTARTATSWTGFGTAAAETIIKIAETTIAGLEAKAWGRWAAANPEAARRCAEAAEAARAEVLRAHGIEPMPVMDALFWACIIYMLLKAGISQLPGMVTKLAGATA